MFFYILVVQVRFGRYFRHRQVIVDRKLRTFATYLFPFFHRSISVNMTSSPSRSVLPQSYRDGVFIKELDELKKLLQQTNVEMKACMSRCCGKPQRTESPPAPSGGENSNELCGDVSDNDDDELLNDVRLEAGHVSQIIEGKAYQASSSLAKKEEDPAGKDSKIHCLEKWK